MAPIIKLVRKMDVDAKGFDCKVGLNEIIAFIHR